MVHGPRPFAGAFVQVNRAAGGPHSRCNGEPRAKTHKIPAFPQSMPLAFLFGRKAGRNALSSKQTCWSTVHVRTEQDAPDETRALGHALNSFSANDSRSVRRADGEWPSHPLVVCEGGAVASFAEDTLSVSTDTLHAQPLTDNVHGDAFVSVVAHCSCIRVEHNFYTA